MIDLRTFERMKAAGYVSCGKCDGVGATIWHHGQGYYADGSFGHNQWRDCDRCAGTGLVEPKRDDFEEEEL